MDHLHYFSEFSQEEYELANTLCSTCGTPDPGEYGWWEVGSEPMCTPCTMLAEEVAEAGDEPLVLGQVNTIGQADELARWKDAGIDTN